MANVNHSDITDPNIHEPKGVSSADLGEIYVADGAGSGSWQIIPTGWGYYKDNASAQTFTTSDAKLTINGGDAATEESYLPLVIRGSDSLWDTSTSDITPIAVGDQYVVRLSLPVTAKASSPTKAIVSLDIGAGGTPSNIIVQQELVTTGTPPYTLTASFPVFITSTFLANGGQFFLATDTGSVDITAPAILVARTHGEMT